MNDTPAIVDVSENGVTVRTGLNTTRAGRYDFSIQQGATLSLPITWYNQQQIVVDVTTYSARLKVKASWDATTTLVTLTNTATEGITLDGANDPNITIYRTAIQTAAYTGWTRAVYDLELVTGTTVTRLLEGFVTLRRNVTD